MRKMARGPGLLFVLVGLTISPFAFAQTNGPDVAGAETLFDQGRKLMGEGKLDEACPKFAESQRLAPAAGTALNLATCFEKQGKTASAWGMYREAISLSVASGQAVREQFARDRATELEPKLIKLVVNVANPDDQGLEVRRDNIVITRAQWGTPIPVDPGAHTIEAKATKKKKWIKSIETKGNGTTQTVAIPALEDAPEDEAATPAPGEQKGDVDNGGTLRIVGFITMGVGVLALGAGGYFALDSSSKKDDIEGAASNGEAWSADRQSTYDDGKSSANLANIFFVGGGVALATGAVLTILGYSKKHDTGKAPQKSGPTFAGGSVTPRGGAFAWTF